MIGCDCPVCTSDDPRDRRLRSSVLVRAGEVSILIDTSPDLREQALRAGFRRLDAVLYTHAHADHTAGLDELRVYNLMQQRHLPVWSTPETGNDLETRYGYAFEDTFPRYGMKPDLDLHAFDGPFDVAGVTVTPIPIMHGYLPIVGYRIGDLAYLTDLKVIPETSLPLLEGVDTLVITALRQAQHPAHMTLDEAIATIGQIGPRQAWLTHISHDLGLYRDVAPTLPGHVRLATDGEIIDTAR